MQRYYSVNEDINSSGNKIRIVHISDTHLHHEELVHTGSIPDGDILIHSGDFLLNKPNRTESHNKSLIFDIQLIDTFFSRLSHKYKIFIAGNHEISFMEQDSAWITDQFKNCYYLQDSSIILHGIKFYGTPWNGLRQGSAALGFAVPFSDLHKYWALVPDDVDVMISHSPPYGIMDLGLNPAHRLHEVIDCEPCGTTHVGMSHFGCKYLKKDILERIRPRVHLFGHAHEAFGVQLIDGILFSNAASPCGQMATVIDYYTKSTSEDLNP